MDKTSLGDRMKSYERWGQTQPLIPPVLPIVVRVDGKTFSKWTGDLARPYEPALTHTMVESAAAVMSELLTESVLAYGQSDECTFILRPGGENRQSQFGGKREKLVSLTAAAFTAAFNRIRQEHSALKYKSDGIFDARAFPLPNHQEVVNCLIWRQQDAVRNSIQMLGRAYFSHQHLHGKTSSEIQEMLWENHRINWDRERSYFKRGWCITRETVLISPDDMHDIPERYRPSQPVERRMLIKHLTEDTMPTFTKNRDFVLALLKD